jgi:ABC-type bacteriocin/lantibiotic exporter with double-glycine peptidase domain
MIRKDILGGLKLAISNGETLEQAMHSFYNAGYKKQDIEEAARNINFSEMKQNEIFQKNKPEKLPPIAPNREQQPIKNLPSQDSQFNKLPKTSSINDVKQSVSNYNSLKKPKNQKKKKGFISDYSSKKSITGKILLIILLVSFLILLILLGVVIFFKPELQHFLA